MKKVYRMIFSALIVASFMLLSLASTTYDDFMCKLTNCLPDIPPKVVPRSYTSVFLTYNYMNASFCSFFFEKKSLSLNVTIVVDKADAFGKKINQYSSTSFLVSNEDDKTENVLLDNIQIPKDGSYFNITVTVTSSNTNPSCFKCCGIGFGGTGCGPKYYNFATGFTNNTCGPKIAIRPVYVKCQ